MKIPLDKIVIRRIYLRREISEEDIAGMARDLERDGQIQPIAVKKAEADLWELVAGRRRLEAAKRLGWTHLEAYEGEYRQGILQAALSENIRRTNLSPLEEADTVLWMHTEGNMSISEIAETTGHGTSWVQDRLAVGNLPENLKQAVHTRALSISAALLLSQITDEDYRDYLLHCAKTNGATVHQVEAWLLDWTARQKMIAAQNWQGAIPQPPPLPPPPPFTCFLCTETQPRENAIVVTICTDCCTEVKAQIAKAASPTNVTASSDDGEPVDKS